MIRKLKYNLVLIASFLMVASFTGILPEYAAAASDCGNGDNTTKGQVLQGAGLSGTTDCSGQGVTNVVGTVVNILSTVVGITAVIMVILSGFRYTTSGGDSGKITSAKNSLIYALVGIFIAALAQFLVHFVFTHATT